MLFLVGDEDRDECLDKRSSCNQAKQGIGQAECRVVGVCRGASAKYGVEDDLAHEAQHVRGKVGCEKERRRFCKAKTPLQETATGAKIRQAKAKTKKTDSQDIVIAGRRCIRVRRR